MAEGETTRRLTTIVAADVAGYSRLMGLHEEETLAALSGHRKELIDPNVAAHGGRIANTAGDSILIEFPSVVEALRSAIEIQRGMVERNLDIPEDSRIVFRMGINLGDVMAQGGDLFGDGVNIAARLEGLAEPGGICVSRAARDQVRDRMDVVLEDMGEVEVKNIVRPIRAFRVLAPGQVPAPPRRLIGKKSLFASAVVILVSAMAVGGLWWGVAQNTDFDPADPTKMPYKLPDKPSIAVLPFTNMSGDKEQEYFADGIAEDIITDLSKVSGLFVVARNSSFTYKGRTVKVREIAEDLGVRYILEGSVRRSGDRIRINAQLIDAIEGNHVWAERYDRKLVDVFDLQDEVAEKVVAALAVTFKAGEQDRLRRKYTVSPEDYDLFLHARAILSTPMSDSKRLLYARRLFVRVIERAPGFPGGYAGLSATFSLDVMRGISRSPSQDAKMALEWAGKASEIDEHFGLSQIAMANALQISGKPSKAVKVLEKMLESETSNADAYAQLGLFRMWAGRAKEAGKPIKKAIRLNPGLGSPYLTYLGFVNFTLGSYTAAISAFEENETRGGPIDDAILAVWAASYNELGRESETANLVARLENDYPDFHLKSFRFLMNFKRPDDRQRLFEKLAKTELSVDRPMTR